MAYQPGINKLAFRTKSVFFGGGGGAAVVVKFGGPQMEMDAPVCRRVVGWFMLCVTP